MSSRRMPSMPTGRARASSAPVTQDSAVRGMKARVVALTLVIAVAVVGSIAFVLHEKHSRREATAREPKLSMIDLAGVLSGPRIVFRSTSLANYGVIAAVRLADPGGARAISTTSCDRVYSAGTRTICLRADRGILTTYKTEILASDLHVERTLPLAGIPSRARLSPDGAFAATTSFTAGDSYASTTFSTRTIISALDGNLANVNLEDFTLVHNGKTIRPRDRNYWGVTFTKDDDVFYATVAFGGHTYLARGSRVARTMTTMHEDAECPSLSPDGRTVVYKKHGSLPRGQWRLASYDLASDIETVLAETRSVDDQVEWLDDGHVIYGIPRSGAATASDDVYSLPVDGTGAPTLLIQDAWSPAVVR